MKKALILCGGWDGHEPEKTSVRFARLLKEGGVESDIITDMSPMKELDYVMQYDLIVACWTMGEIDGQVCDNICNAVAHGVGLAGCHGGMCDAFRENTNWQFMTGGQWVSHPGGDGIDYTVNIRRGTSPIIDGIEDFHVCSEHYYLHIDPSIEVLATTRFPLVTYYHASNKPVDMPVVWTKYWGIGRVFYTSLGHHDDVFDNSPAANVIMKRGLLWAADSKEYAKEHKLDAAQYENNAKMY